MQFYDSLKLFFEQNEDKIFRYWVFRKWPAYEEEYDPGNEFVDEVCDYGKIVDVIKLSDYDYLVGIQPAECSSDHAYVEYYKFDELRFAYSNTDQNED